MNTISIETEVVDEKENFLFIGSQVEEEKTGKDAAAETSSNTENPESDKEESVAEVKEVKETRKRKKKAEPESEKD